MSRRLSDQSVALTGRRYNIELAIFNSGCFGTVSCNQHVKGGRVNIFRANGYALFNHSFDNVDIGN